MFLVRLEKIDFILEEENGIGKSTFDPDHSLTSVMTGDESLYVGTSLDFLGKNNNCRSCIKIISYPYVKSQEIEGLLFGLVVQCKV